jgi:hypothetical protein
MATKSVIEIDVLDERFQAFAKEFEKIQKAIKGMPKDWQNSFQTGIAGAKSTSSEIDKATKKQKDYNKALNDGYMILRNTSKTTADIAKSMASTVLSASKWLGLGSLLSTGGVVALASQISQDRTKGLRINVPTSQLRAAETTYGQLFPINSILEQISNARFDPLLRSALERQGANFKTQNVLEVFETVLPKLADTFKQFDPQTAKIRYQAMGLEGTGISLQDIYESENMKPGELQSLIAQRIKRTGQLQTSEETDKVMQEFYSNIKNAGRAIEIGLTKAIEPFIPYLNSFVNIISNFVAEHGAEFGQGALSGLKEIGKKEHEIIDETKDTIKNFKDKLKKREQEGGRFTFKRLDEVLGLSDILKHESNVWEKTKEHFGFGGGYTEEVIGEYKGKPTLDTMKYNSPEFNALLEKTKKDYKEQFGKDFPINSLLRDWDKQYQLFLDPKSYTPTDPRKYPKDYIFHKNALDTNVDPSWMEKEGWMRKNPKGDPVHYQIKDTNVSVNIFDNTGGNIIYNASAMGYMG